MKLKELFVKSIDRNIKGVVKVGQDDEATIQQELEEYVVTKELNRHFSTFFDAFKESINNSTDKMGVWISGFFGSGKSHFLKILSYLLDNRTVNGQPAVSYFEDKIHDEMVLGDMKKAGDISSDVILFNIDSKSDSDSKTDKEAILKVFNKVFNEMQGFCGSLPWLANLERKMVTEGSYDNFRKKYAELSGKQWEDSREDFYFEGDSIVESLASATRMSSDDARRWFHKAEDSYSLSIEKFANTVKEYIESKETEHHVIFLVDEMGQYVGDDVRLMLNLQTIVENLGTYCGGKAWVIVTSQQDIDTVTKVRGNDFSKIQGRFNTRISLSSANVDEVIKKRILLKSDVARDTLQLLYTDKEVVLKNLITFTSDTPEMKTFSGAEDFVDIYPFVPYQFKLLQSVFTAIRQHGASGKHLAEGERSLLSAFQEATIQYMKEDTGFLIPFSAFYETIETFLDHNISIVVGHAIENSRLKEMDIEVLKVLFLIKWVKEMPSNLENISTLLVRNIDDDKIELKKDIEESLGRLLKETLIQKNGDEYIFLTHEEQDVNREIQNIVVERTEIIKYIGEELFEGIYTDKRFRYNARYSFDFNKTVDEMYMNRDRAEVGVRVLTPYFVHETNDSELKMMSSRENNLILRLPEQTPIIDEVEEILKIETYLRRHSRGASAEIIEEIKSRKSREASDRRKRAKGLLTEAIGEADLFVDMQKLELKTKNPIERINSGLSSLIKSIYSKLHYIDTFVESPKDLIDILSKKTQQEIFEDNVPNKLALDELKYLVQLNTDRNTTLTLKTIIDEYSKAPYGWLPDDIKGLVLRLFVSQEIRLQLGAEYISPSNTDVINYVTKREYGERLVVSQRTKVSPELIANARNLLQDIFDYAAAPTDEDALMRDFKDLSSKELSEIKQLLVRYEEHKYPGKDVLEKGTELFGEISEIKGPEEFFTRLYEIKDELSEYGERVVPVKRFFENQKQHFDKAQVQVEIYEKNETYVLDNDVKQIIQDIEAIIEDPEPYSDIAKLPQLIDGFIKRFTNLLEEESKPVQERIESDRKEVEDELNANGIEEDRAQELLGRFDRLLEKLRSSNSFNEVIAMKEESERVKAQCINEIARIINDKGEDYKSKRPATIRIREVVGEAVTIKSAEDIDQFLNKLRKLLQEQLDKNETIKLI